MTMAPMDEVMANFSENTAPLAAGYVVDISTSEEQTVGVKED